jgi:hypothetical protein
MTGQDSCPACFEKIRKRLIVFFKKMLDKKIVIKKSNLNFDTPNDNRREFSSVGLEHLPYKQRVGGSTPSTPTEKGSQQCEPFCF